MKTQWRAILASAIAALLGTAGILWAATSSPPQSSPAPVHHSTPVPMPGMQMSHGAAALTPPVTVKP